jgi:hypothetical protein
MNLMAISGEITQGVSSDFGKNCRQKIITRAASKTSGAKTEKFHQ